jgi:hypothetical protein
MKNKLIDLNNSLMDQIQRLEDCETGDEKLKTEVERSKAISHVASKIIDNGRLVLDAQKHIDEGMAQVSKKLFEIFNTSSTLKLIEDQQQ